MDKKIKKGVIIGVCAVAIAGAFIAITTHHKTKI